MSFCLNKHMYLFEEKLDNRSKAVQEIVTWQANFIFTVKPSFILIFSGIVSAIWVIIWRLGCYSLYFHRSCDSDL